MEPNKIPLTLMLAKILAYLIQKHLILGHLILGYSYDPLKILIICWSFFSEILVVCNYKQGLQPTWKSGKTGNYQRIWKWALFIEKSGNYQGILIQKSGKSGKINTFPEKYFLVIKFKIWSLKFFSYRNQ